MPTHDTPVFWRIKKMNCPKCGTKLKRQFTPESVEIYWCETCQKYIEYEEEEEEEQPAGGKDGLNSK